MKNTPDVIKASYKRVDCKINIINIDCILLGYSNEFEELYGIRVTNDRGHFILAVLIRRNVLIKTERESIMKKKKLFESW